MVREVALTLDPESSADVDKVKKLAARTAGVPLQDISEWRIIHRSIDARRKNIRVHFKVLIATGTDLLAPEITPFRPRNVTGKPEVIIVGSGPAGLFAALRLIELGIKPVVLERGNDVSLRKRDIARISREHSVNPDSNYCFGEGGAGTFSDGKLYTRSHKRGNNLRVFELLCYHGANRNILYESHPHIGSDKLPGIVQKIRKSITDAGGTILFQTAVKDFIIKDNKIAGVTIRDGSKLMSNHIILATGHSARDIYEILLRRKIEMQFKQFAVGVRVEHPRLLIDNIQYHGTQAVRYLPAASYSLVRQIDGRGVYSFCMCPGGFVIPSATSGSEVVLNGMSPSSRNSKFSNSGIVVEVKAEDLSEYMKYEAMAGVMFQGEIERKTWDYGGRTQKAPAQRLADFVEGKFSSSLPEVSYFPGVTSSAVHELLPPFIISRLQNGFRYFGKVMKGFLTNEAVVMAVESRTSSPVRILRNENTLEHIRISGLYPCGEGAGYAGGIVSSAVDGIRVAEAISSRIKP